MVVTTVSASCKRKEMMLEAKRERVEKEILLGEIKTGKGLNQEVSIARAGDTRWGSHHKTITSLLKLFPEVVDVLAFIKEDGESIQQRSNAKGILSYFKKLEFVFYIHLLDDILRLTNALSKHLQTKSQDLLQAAKLINGTKRALNHLRQSGFDFMLARVTSFCEKHKIKMLDMAESYGNPRIRKNVITNRHHYEVEVFNTILDMQIVEFGSRFSELSTTLIENMSGLNPCNSFSNFDISRIVAFSEMYPSDFDIHERSCLAGDLSVFYHTVTEDDRFEKLDGLCDLARVMVETGKNNTFPLVYRVLKLALVLPVATATVERCFSKMKLIKSDLRNRMGDEYLNNALICAVEKETFLKVKEEDEYEVVGEFSQGTEADSEDEEENDEVVVLEVDGNKSRFEEFKWQRIERIRNDVREYGDGIIDVDELSSVYNFRIDKFQRLAIQAFLRGSSVVVSAPTSAGKTLIAEAAAVATVARGRRLFYTTPLKALSNQKFREFCDAFGEDNVGLLTGDSAINRDAQVLIMTTEILRNMLYQSVGIMSSESGLFHVDVIVLDEVHYLSDISRGTVWEEIVIYCPKEVQLICLSATVANPDELSGWINQIHGKTELVTSTKRPVPLNWHFSTKTALFPLLNETGTSMNRKLSTNYLQLDSLGAKSYEDEKPRRRNSRNRDSDVSPSSKNDRSNNRRSQVPQVIDTLWHLKTRDMLPAVWFIFSRKGCDVAVQYLEDCKLLDECEMSEVDLALKRFRIKYPDAVRESAVKGILRGVAAHHAGCLPLWKSFIEELFQRGLVKVVFATETLAAGINMPARTAVISSLSKRSERGRIQLTTNELLQMAGRAGRRGIDKTGHAVVVQTPYEGAEECCKLLFAGLQPLVSQFTASYGMVLNLLAGAKVTQIPNIGDGTEVSRTGRTLEEARKLVEQSFGNYVGSNVMLAAQDELNKIQSEIQILTSEISDEAIDKKSKNILSKAAYKEMAELQEELRAEKRVRTELRRRMEMERMSSLRPLLQTLGNEQLPFLCLQYHDNAGTKHLVPAVYLGDVDSMRGSKLKNMIADNDSFAIKVTSGDAADPESQLNSRPSYYVALGSDNTWYLFTERCIKSVYRAGFPNTALNNGDALPQEIMTRYLENMEMQWQKLSQSELGGIWCMDGSLETWSWSLNVPVLSSFSEDNEVVQYSQAYYDAVESYKNQRNKVSQLKKRIAKTEGFKEYKKIVDVARFTEEKIQRLKARSNRLMTRLEQIEPSGWKEFLQVSNVIHEIRALDINTNVLFPLGETAAAIRGENELWIAMVLRNKVLSDLKPPQLAAVCGSIVSEGIKVRPNKNNSYIYEPSSTVLEVINFLDDQRSSLLQLQEKHDVQISCCLDSQFSGMVEAWASGLTWREMMMDCAMDEGDLARLLRRTIDVLAQIPKLPDIDPQLQRNAIAASGVMDRPPISELAG